jgi:putative serine protease PepD
MAHLKLTLGISTAAVFTAVVLGATTIHATRSAQAVESPSSGALSLQSDFVSVVHNVLPSVVQVETASGLGSGIVFDNKGDIVTNDHVVGSATTFAVTTSSGKQFHGTLVGVFVQDDLAVIKVAGAGLRPASFADSSTLAIGDLAIAIGNPLGLQSSVTEGIVSQLDRSESEGNGVTLADTIQTSAAINPGNSGGALVDLGGHVIGIPTLAAVNSEAGTAASGIGFAIPSNVVKDIASQIIKYGHVVDSHRPYLGVTIADTMSANGVYVSAVTAGGPAGKAGIVVGNVIIAVNGKPTPTSDDLGTVIANFKPGQTVTLKLTRQDGATASVKLILGQFPGGTT